LLSGFSAATDIYITQNALGADSGANCANAHSAAWFNSNATGGNTYHLCGAFSGTAGSTMLIVPSGSAGNVLTVLFEPGAILTAPYWGGQYAGAINIPAHSYIKIDGGSNGVIQNTANGDSLLYQQPLHGIYVQNGSSNVEITHVTIKNTYMSISGGTGNSNALSTANVLIGSGGVTNVSVHDCILQNAGQGVEVDWDGGVTNNINIYNNTITDHRFGVQVGSWVSSGSTSNINIYGKSINDWSNCNTSNNYYHLDGIIIWGDQGYPTNVSIYNNYIYGDFVANGTAFIYCTWDGLTGTGTSSVCNIFNNVIVINNSNNQGKAFGTGSHTGPPKLLNNTIIGQAPSSGLNNLIQVDGVIGLSQNNLFLNSSQAISSYASTFPSNVTTSDYNLYYGFNSQPFVYNISSGGIYISYSQWQSLGYDANGLTGNPSLDSNYKPQAGSAAIGKGTNLTGLGITALNSDKAGYARPASGAWDIGACQYSPMTSVVPPASLIATVN
jgi:hypothetical protein